MRYEDYTDQQDARNIRKNRIWSELKQSFLAALPGNGWIPVTSRKSSAELPRESAQPVSDALIDALDAEPVMAALLALKADPTQEKVETFFDLAAGVYASAEFEDVDEARNYS